MKQDRVVARSPVPDQASAAESERWLRVPTRELAFVQAILEAYEGLASITTLRDVPDPLPRGDGQVCRLLCATNLTSDLDMVLTTLGTQIPLVPLMPGSIAGRSATDTTEGGDTPR